LWLVFSATIYSPLAPEILRNNGNNNAEGILTLAEFLQFAKNNSGVGIYIDVQNAVYLRTFHSLDIVDAVINALKTANLTSETDKVLIASEDSSALAAFQQAMPYHQRVYRVPYLNPNAGTVTPPVLQEIKNYASFVAIPSQLVDPLDDFSGNASTYFLAAATQVVKQAHALNLTVLYYWQENEFQAFPFDYRSDPILQINSLVSFYNVDGIITDFPATVYDFLHKNQCYKPTLSMMPANYTMLTVMPGSFLEPVAEAPAPALQVVEPPISFEVPVPASSPAPSPTVVKPSAASKLSLTFTSTLTFASLLLCILL
jgi:glycerophosphoryl diester phosphodiesterase